MTLFIIGNGFDLSHQLKTSYKNFYKYLKKNYPSASENSGVHPTATLGNHGEIWCEIEMVEFLYDLLSNVDQCDEDRKWGDFENSLGDLDYFQNIDQSDYPLDSDGDKDLWKTSQMNEELASCLIPFTGHLKKFFEDWINTIEIDEKKHNSKENFLNLMNKEEDIFLTFNYTNTLEKIYKVNERNICYIHGKVGEKLIVGHGLSEEKTEEEIANNFYKYLGAENNMTSSSELLRKNTQKQINLNQNFFELISEKNIDKIYVYGFSFSMVDQPYIKEIIERLNGGSKVEWYLNSYDKENFSHYSEVLVEFGFEGKVRKYTI